MLMLEDSNLIRVYSVSLTLESFNNRTSDVNFYITPLWTIMDLSDVNAGRFNSEYLGRNRLMSLSARDNKDNSYLCYPHISR